MKNLIISALLLILTPTFAFAQENPDINTQSQQPQPTSVTESQSQSVPQPQSSPTPIEDNGEIDRRDIVEPREMQEVLRQIKDIKREAAKILRKAAKAGLTSDANRINEIISQVIALEKILKGSPDAVTHETLQEYYDSQIWDQLNEIRIRIEMPSEIKSIEKELKKLDKMLNKKSFNVDGVDMARVKIRIENVRTALSQAKENLAQGNLEEAQEAMQIFYEEGLHPGEIMGVLNRLSEISKRFKRIKNEETKNDIKEVLGPIYEAVANNDFREANMLFNEIERDLWSILDSLSRKPSMNNNMRSRMEKLEQKLQNKMEQEDQATGKMNKQSYFNYKRYSASLFEQIIDWFGL